MKEYFRHLNKINEQHPFIKKMKESAINNNIPIINDEGLSLIFQLIKITRANYFLEIGTAIAYTAINVALYDENIIVDTIERDKKMYLNALENIKQLSLNDRINIYNHDALDLDIKVLNKKYDIIFIDAAKAQYQKFFEKYESLLSDRGLFVCDNLLFHGLVESDEEIKSRSLRSLVNKIRNFNSWLANNKKYQTVFLNIGDGMAVSIKK
ncbi:MAG TPA: O-methyltransferase [Acholeplasmataceae bacterium]|jgi:predicted O-methyltransferase YrrM|nr:O-methyltransferase [Acholeplasmataceae bacterium]